jgi:menaquinone-9 beta-reductase
MTQTHSFDVVVLGAGTAGSAAAAFLAQAGRSVALLDAKPLDRAGARWVNGVPPWMFDRVGLARPTGPELRGDANGFTLAGRSGRVCLTLDPSPIWGVDMRLLVSRLQGLALDAGARLWGGARVTELALTGNRPTALEVQTEGGRLRLRADLFVDASGRNGAIRRRVPELARHCRPVPAEHLCSAAQSVCHVADPVGARAFMDAHGLRDGHVLCKAGVSGGYSITNVGVEGDEVDLLTGAIAQPQYQSGPALLDGLRAQHPWIGDEVFGGAGVIPLRRPYDRLGAPGVALLGDAACQVFGAHGSGIGLGLLAARQLADVVGHAEDPGALESVWAYQAAFHRTWGPLVAISDLFRRHSQAQDEWQIEAMLSAGLMSPASYEAGLAQQIPVMDLVEGVRTAAALARHPRVGAGLLATAARMGPAVALYRRHPQRPDPVALGRWSRRVARVFGDPPDIPRA